MVNKFESDSIIKEEEILSGLSKKGEKLEVNYYECINSIHKKLIQRYGSQIESKWEPNLENVLMLGDEEFENEFKKLEKYQDKSEQEKKILDLKAKNMIAYANFLIEKILIKKSSTRDDPLLLEQSFAHEELHIFCKRNKIDPDEYSYYVNETFIDYLALRGLNFMDKPLKELPEDLHNHVANAMYIHEVLDALGKDSDKFLFDICQGKSQDTLKNKLNEYYGYGPAMNKTYNGFYGTDFYSRFKELALFINIVGKNPKIQYTQASIAFHNLMINWITSKKEIKHLSRPDLF